MATARRALIWLPDLDSAQLQWAANHPVHRTGLARWWQRSRKARYTPQGQQLRNLVWRQHAVEWRDLASYLRDHPHVAQVVRDGGMVRVRTTSSSRDMFALLLGMVESFPAAEVVVDLIVDDLSMLEAWGKESRLTVATLISPTASSQKKQQAVQDRRGVMLPTVAAAQQYLTTTKQWTAVILPIPDGTPVVTLTDDRHYAWKDSVKDVRISTLLAKRSPSLWQVVSQRPQSTHLAVHRDAPPVALHTADPQILQRYSDQQAVMTEVISAAPELLSVVAPAPDQHAWQQYDDQLSMLILQLTNQDYTIMAVGVPASATADQYPIFSIGARGVAPADSIVRAPELTDVRDAVWSYAGAATEPSWLLTEFLLS